MSRPVREGPLERSTVARETLTVLARRSALAGRTAIVTGASGAFGSATMEVLRYLGAHPIGIDRKPGDGVLACDVTDGEQVAPVIGEATGQLGGRLDLLIHYAGVGPAVDVGQPPGEETREALDVNLLGCRSWYLNDVGRNVSLWPDFTWAFAWQTRRFDVSSYEVLLPHPQ